MVDHNNGILLLFARLDNKLFQEIILPRATAILFMRHRVRFYREDGTQGGSPGIGSVLIAFGSKNAEILRRSGIAGFYLPLADGQTIK